MRPNLSADAAQEILEREAIVRLMGNASVEMTIHDEPHLAACGTLLRGSVNVYVSYLPKQNWEQTQRTVMAVRAAGFEPIPHVPARQIEDHAQLEDLLRRFAAGVAVRRILLIAGDRRTPLGPFGSTIDVLQTGLLANHGIQGVIVAGHPEGHPSIPAQALRANERAKVEAAQRAGLDVTFLTQFCFTAAPIISWIQQLRANGIRSPVVAGLAGPARLATLVKYAAICGIGPSLRNLGARAGALSQLATERGPETIIRALARAACDGTVDLAGVHFFSFGGLTRTCTWLSGAARGQIRLSADTFYVD